MLSPSGFSNNIHAYVHNISKYVRLTTSDMSEIIIHPLPRLFLYNFFGWTSESPIRPPHPRETQSTISACLATGRDRPILASLVNNTEYTGVFQSLHITNRPWSRYPPFGSSFVLTTSDNRILIESFHQGPRNAHMAHDYHRDILPPMACMVSDEVAITETVHPLA
jgi:hypothetical protein